MIVETKIDNQTHQMRITRERTARLSDKQRCASCIFAFWVRAPESCAFSISIDSAQNSPGIRGELMESPHPYGQGGLGRYFADQCYIFRCLNDPVLLSHVAGRTTLPKS